MRKVSIWFLSLMLVAAALFGCMTVMAEETDPAVVLNSATGVAYEDLSKALAEAETGETLILQQDVGTLFFSVPDGVTVDLNGKTLTATYVSAFGNIEDGSAENTGLLKVDANKLLLKTTNSQLPVKTAEGYKFISMRGFNTRVLDGGARYVFQPLFEAAAHEMLKDGAAATGVSVQVLVTWKSGADTDSRTFVFGDNFVTQFINSYVSTGGYGKMFQLTVSNPEKFEDLQYTAMVVTESGVTYQPAKLPAEVTEDVTLQDGQNSALVSAGTKLTDGDVSLSLVTTEMENTTSSIVVGEGETARSMDIHVNGLSKDNTVPVIVTVNEFAVNGLNEGNIALYHVENGEPVKMTRVYSVAEVDAHNEYYYDIATGTVTMALANFCEVAVVSDDFNFWNGEAKNVSWYNENDTQFYIYNADQLAGFGQLVDGGNTFKGKTITLCLDVYLSDGSHADGTKSFNPIGFGYEFLSYDYPECVGKGKVFKGTFDGNGNTIYNLYQNCWEMGADTYTYSAVGAGLFASVVDATIKNLTMDNAYIVLECVDMGTVVGYANGKCHFENIVVKNSVLGNHNRCAGGAIGEIGGGGTYTLKNVDVEASTTISGLWGSFGVAAGGLIGGKWGAAGTYYDKTTAVSVTMENCDVACTLDVYNDVTSAYQWYAYRFCGMLIGHTEEWETEESGRTVATASWLKTENCTVQYGNWVDYTYCRFSKTTSLGGRYPWVRVERGRFTDPYSNIRYGVPQFAEGTLNAETHIDDENCHAKTDEHCLPIIVNQLYGGDQGVYGGNGHVGNGVTVIGQNGPVSPVNKFNANDITITTGSTLTLGQLFTAVDDLDELSIQNAYVYAFVSPADETSGVQVDATHRTTANASTPWTDLELTFNGTGMAKITISDYYYCQPTTITVNVIDFTAEPGMYQLVDTVDSGEYVIVTKYEGTYYALQLTGDADKGTAVPVNVVGNVVVDAVDGDLPVWNVVANGDSVIIKNSNGKYLTHDDTSDSSTKLTIDKDTFSWNVKKQNNGLFWLNTTSEIASGRALSLQSNNGLTFRVYGVSNATRSNFAFDLYLCKLIECEHPNAVEKAEEAATCTTNGYTAGKYCPDCESWISGHEVIAAAHKWGEVVITPATCTEAGVETVTCTVCGETTTETIKATGHSYVETVTKEATCVEDGVKTFTCSACNDSYTEVIKATGHSFTDGNETCDNCTEPNPAMSAGWKLVTDVTELKAGDKLVIASKEEGKLATDIATTYLGECSATFSADGKIVTVTENTLQFTLGGTQGAWTLSANDKLLGATAVKTVKWDAGTTTWTISIDSNGNATIQNLTSSYGRILHNVSYSRFTTYTSDTSTSMLLPQLYKWDDACNHIVVNVEAKAATCTEAGYTAGTKCSVCNTILSGCEEIPATGHVNTTTTTVNATCTEAGSKTVTCACGETVSTETIPALGHTWGDATCTETKTCSVCGAEGEATGHTEVVDAAVAPTCTETGLTEGKHCSVCNEVLVAQTVVDALGHTEVIDEAVAATCTTAGKTEGKHCSRCNTVLVAQETVNALGHIDANSDGKCDVCGDAVEAESVEATLTFDNTSKRTEFSTSKQVWKENGITVTNNKGSSTSNVADYADPARFYKNSQLIVTAPGKITQIVFDCNSASYATALQQAISDNATANGDKVTVTFATGVESFSVVLSEDQVRMDSLTVTYVGTEPESPEESVFEKATSISVGDKVVFVYETGNMELTEISTTSTPYGIGTAYTGTPAGLWQFTVVAGSSDKTYAFEDANGNYLCWSSGNSLKTSKILNANSSWTVTFESGNAVIKNVADKTRILQWNASNPRFACYTSSQTPIQLYKAATEE